MPGKIRYIRVRELCYPNSNRRHFALPSGLAKIVGKPAVFSLANSWAKFYQVDTHRKPVAMKDEF